MHEFETKFTGHKNVVFVNREVKNVEIKDYVQDGNGQLLVLQDVDDIFYNWSNIISIGPVTEP